MEDIVAPLSSKPQVFLSFRGETRKKFTNFLYEALQDKGYEIFIDEELKRGKKIAQQLFEAVEESKFAIVVFSRKYASSTWCLRELAKIMECNKNGGLTVYPVFYYVDPSDLRKLTGKFVGEAFERREKRFQPEEVKLWKEAVAELGHISGEDVKDRKESEVIKKIVKVVSETLEPLLSSTVIKDNVGIESRINNLKVYLNREGEDVCIVGIWGIRGTGKTTLAKEVFERIRGSFHISGIVYITNEYRGNRSEHRMILLQKHFFEHVLKCKEDIQTIALGASKIKQRLRSKKVLIILDDVDQQEQIEALVGKPGEQHDWFGSESRIIVTTRNRELLKKYGDNYSNIYKVEELTEDEGLQFFYRKAFKNKHPPNDVYKNLSTEFVRYARGLPFALVSLCDLLYKLDSEEKWKKKLEDLAKNPDEEISKELRLSYDALSTTHQQIFLQIALSLDGEDECQVMKKLEGRGYNVDTGITVLVDRSLITIEGGKVLVHYFLKQMARYIKHEEKKAEKHSRSNVTGDANHAPTENKLPDDISRLSSLKQPAPSERNLQSSTNNHLSSSKISETSDSPDSSDGLTMGSSGMGLHFTDSQKSSRIDEHCILQAPPAMTNVLTMTYVHPDNLSRENIEGMIGDGKLFQTRFSSYRIPNWFLRRCPKPPLKIKLPLEGHEYHDLECRKMKKGFAIFVVFQIKKHYKHDKLQGLNSISCHFNIDDEPQLENSLAFGDFKDFTVGSYAVCFYVPIEWFAGKLNTSSCNLHTSVSATAMDIGLRMLGIREVFDQQAVGDLSNNLAQSANEHLELESNFNKHCKELLDGETCWRVTRNETVHTPTGALDSVYSIVKNVYFFFISIKTRRNKHLIDETYSSLTRLFQEKFAPCNQFSFAFPFPIISPGFFHQSVGNVALCYLPPNIENDERWLGLELYVQCKQCQSDSVDDLASEVGYLYISLYSHIEVSWVLVFSHQLSIIDSFVLCHVPREYFLKPLNNCKCLGAFFQPTTPDMEVKMCGTRLLYKQDSELISKGIIECTFHRDDHLRRVHEESHKWLNQQNINAVGQKTPRPSTEANRKVKKKLNSLVEHLARTELEAIEVSTSLHNYREEYADGQAVNDFDPVLFHDTQYFLDNWDRTKEDTSASLSATFNHLHIMAETLIYASNSQEQIQNFKSILEESFKHRIPVTLSLKGHIIFVLRHFHPSSPYNLCFPSEGIPNWFSHQQSFSKVAIKLPQNLSDDKRWRGLVICAAFSVKGHPNTFPKASFKFLCHLTSEGVCLNPVALCSITKSKIKWLLLDGFIWLTFIPHAMLTELNGKRSIEARIYNYCPSLIVDKCGIHLLYENAVEGLEQTIIQGCTSVVENFYSIHRRT